MTVVCLHFGKNDNCLFTFLKIMTTVSLYLQIILLTCQLFVDMSAVCLQCQLFVYNMGKLGMGHMPYGGIVTTVQRIPIMIFAQRLALGKTLIEVENDPTHLTTRNQSIVALWKVTGKKLREKYFDWFSHHLLGLSYTALRHFSRLSFFAN